RLLEMLRSLAHVALYVRCAPKGEVNASLRSGCFSRDRSQSCRFQFVTVISNIVSTVLMVIPNVVAVAHKLKVVQPTVIRREVIVVDYCALAGKRWNLSQQSLAGHDPMDRLPATGRWMFDHAVAATAMRL